MLYLTSFMILQLKQHHHHLCYHFFNLHKFHVYFFIYRPFSPLFLSSISSLVELSVSVVSSPFYSLTSVSPPFLSFSFVSFFQLNCVCYNRQVHHLHVTPLQFVMCHMGILLIPFSRYPN